MPTAPPIHKPPRSPLRANSNRRPSPSARGYDRNWYRLARLFRSANPLCADPFGHHAEDGCVVAGAHVDHIVPRSAGGTDDWSNLQTLCQRCHSTKTARFDGAFGRARRTEGDGRSEPPDAAAGTNAVASRTFSRVLV